MLEKNSQGVKKTKRLPKGLRTYNRRLKQALRKDQAIVVRSHNKKPNIEGQLSRQADVTLKNES